MLGVRLACFRARWNYILFPADQNISDIKIALKNLTETRRVGAFPVFESYTVWYQAHFIKKI